jgi:hypothetical protein
MQDNPPADLPVPLLPRLIYQRRIPRETWSSSPWVKRVFFRGPWFRIPSLLSARQWKLAISKGALGSPRRRNVDPWLLSQLAALDPIVPILMRLGVVRKDQLNQRKRQQYLKHLDSRDIEVFAGEHLMDQSDVSDALLDQWINRSGVVFSAELIRNGIVSIGRILSKAEKRWPVGKRFALLKHVIDTAQGEDREIIEACVGLCDPPEVLADQLVLENRPEEEELYGPDIREGQKALMMPIAGSFDLIYLVASVNLLNAVANRLRRSRVNGWTSIQLLVEASKRRLARELYEAACSSFEDIDVYLSVDSSFVRAYGLQFGFRSLPVADYAKDLDSRGLNHAQEWWGRRLQPIARSVLEWARSLREEKDREIGSTQILGKLRLLEAQSSSEISLPN